MKKIVRILAAVMALVMMLGLAACGQSAQVAEPAPKAEEAAAAPETPAEAPAEAAAEENPYANWPEKDITVKIQSKAGSGGDTFLRNIAMCIDGTDILNGHSLRVENIVDATGYVPWSQVRDAEPDGYTLAFLSPMIVNSDVLNNTGLKYTDLTYLGAMGGDPQYIVAKTSAPYNTLEEFLAYAKENPIDAACAGSNGQSLPIMLALISLSGVDMNIVSYSTGADQLVAVLGDFCDVCCLEYPDIAAQVEAGELKMIANMGTHRTMADIPTIQESGFDIAIDRPRGFAGPANMDPLLAERITEVFRAAFETEQWQDFMVKNNTDPVFLAGDEFLASYAQAAETMLAYIDQLQ